MSRLCKICFYSLFFFAFQATCINAHQWKYFKGPVECIRTIYENNGLVGCYRGFHIQAIRDLPASIAYFSIYESSRSLLIHYNLTDSRELFASFMAGGTAGVLSWLLIMPFDVVKNTYQAQKSSASVGACVRLIYAQGGVTGFFTGSAAAALRAFPVNSITFLVYNQTMRLLE